MMDAAYFVGRKELLEFFNDLLDLNLGKIEQTAPGNVACQLTDLIFPGSIPMSRVNWEARSDYEFVQNYKLLQNAFNKHNVQRHIDVDKLIRGKYQDNLEFTQWLKAFYDQSGVYRDDYDPRAARARGKGGKKYNDQIQKGASRSKPPPKPKTTASAVVSRPGIVPRASRPLRDRSAVTNDTAKSSSQANQPKKDDVSPELIKKNEELQTKVEELETAVFDIEKERDFYFEKLRHVEIMCQVHQESGGDPEHLVDKVLKVLYATADETIVVDDEGELVDPDELEALEEY
jgi:RP/EB family microtubule-associated protein